MNVIDRDDLERAIEALCEAYPKTFLITRDCENHSSSTLGRI